MNIPFSEILRRLRIEKGFSQQQLANALHVDRSTVTKWETGDRMPDAVMISLLSDCLGVNVAELLRASKKSAERTVVIMVDDENIILRGGIPVLERAIPGAEIAAFTIPAEAVAYAKANPVSLAFLDIEMGGSAVWTSAGSFWKPIPNPRCLSHSVPGILL
jgi:transcriptional regulator with XRE-family HTH domain